MSFLGKHWFLIGIALGLGLALLFPGAIQPVTDHWEPRVTVGLSLFLMAWTMPARSLMTELRSPYASVWAMILSYGLVPVGAWLLGFLALETAGRDVQVGLILVSSVPCTLSSAILWTRLAGGNEATALMAVMGTVLISWFATPLLLDVLTETSLEPGVVTGIMLDLLVSLIVPMFVGQGLRLIGPCARFADRYKILLSALSQLFVLAIILKAGVSVGAKLHSEQAVEAPLILLWSVALAVTLHLAALATGMISCRWFGFDRGRQIAVAFSASQKTLQVSLLLYDQYFMTKYPFAVMPLLFYHVGQLLLDTLIARQMAKHSSAVAADDPIVVE